MYPSIFCISIRFYPLQYPDYLLPILTYSSETQSHQHIIERFKKRYNRRNICKIYSFQFLYFIFIVFQTNLFRSVESFIYNYLSSIKSRALSRNCLVITFDSMNSVEENLGSPVIDGFSEKHYTLVFLRRQSDNGNEILLGMKKRGFGVGKWNGLGGKVEANETYEQGAIREVLEESSLLCKSVQAVGYLVFEMQSTNTIMKVHVFESWDFEGTKVESDEMMPEWFPETNVPFENMWLDDPYWFPYLLSGKKFIGRFDYDLNDRIADYTIKES